MSTTTTRQTRSAVQIIGAIVGVVFLIVGVAGFVPGLTTNLGSLSFMGMGSGAMLLGLFQVSILHNIVHLLFGIAGLAFSRSAVGAKRYLVVGGIVYAVLWLYGIVTGMSMANFVPLNAADNVLHLGLAVGMIALGLIVGRHAAKVAAPATERELHTTH